MAKTTYDKAVEIYSKVPNEELYDEFMKLKGHIYLRLSEHQKELEDKASDMQSKLDKINGQN